MKILLSLARARIACYPSIGKLKLRNLVSILKIGLSNLEKPRD